ncbi:MAG: endopeptidase La [Anaerolineaceae bacterium]
MNRDEPFQISRFASLSNLNNVRDQKPDQDGYLVGPAIDLEESLLLPHAMMPLTLMDDPDTLKTLQKAYLNNQTLFACFSKEDFNDPTSSEEPEKRYLEIGLEVAIGSLMNLDNERQSVLLQARHRLKIEDIWQEDGQLMLRGLPIKSRHRKSNSLTALKRAVVDEFNHYAELVEFLNDEVVEFVSSVEDPGDLADMVLSTLDLSEEDRLAFLIETDSVVRLEASLRNLKQEIRLRELEGEIQYRVQSTLDQNQRENYLREQISTLQRELNEGKPGDAEYQALSEALAEIALPQEAREAVDKELDRLANTPPLSPENGLISTYLHWVVDLPWDKETEDNLDINHAREILEKNHFGLQKAKDRILEYLAVRSLKPKRNRQPILCFVGPPGTGKTSLGKSIADALERNFVRVSLGGVHDEAEIRGHRRTYMGALPGRILQTMRKAKTINPVFMLDEIDKLNADFQGDPAAALLEVLDPEQNYAFSDHFLEVAYDLSKVLFITTANTIASIPPALLDRMELIEFPGYILEEKIAIANQFLIPKQMEESGLDGEPILFQLEALKALVEGYTYEAGVRNLEREIGSVLRKIARLKSEQKALPVEISADYVAELLGPAEFFPAVAEQNDEIGMATALAWTENGGEIMPVEVLVMEGKGNLQMTGQIGEIMQESAQAALSYLKSKQEAFQIPSDFFEEMDIHIHVPEGSIPKDGPSAGITLATALTSAVLGVAVRHDVAMTGEITLRGRVLPVGGVREKVLAANRSGITTVLLPRKNEKDLREVPSQVLANIRIELVEHMDEVLTAALADKPISRKPRAAASRAKKKKSAPDQQDAPQAQQS